MLAIFIVTSVFFTSTLSQDVNRILELYNSGLGSKSDEMCLVHDIGCSDCHTISICMVGMNRLKIPCAEPNNYCKDGGCMPTSDNTCPAEASEFDCASNEGTFPDPKDCTMYHVCLNGSAYDYKCKLPFTVYSPETKTCVRKSLKHKCSTVLCTQDGQKVAYPSDPSIFFVCQNGEPAVLQTCPKFSVLNEKTQQCKEHCAEEGPIPDLNDEKSFYECVWKLGTIYVMEHRLCPQIANVVKSVFDPEKRECVLVTAD
ncbi:uncharacterized protein LOC106674348 [Cimex lectularius]|uniref:Chitin-binding type-2 domain-containing protein n=1 Tax=Cimex lectularius TaxID=79782 RepID=A0A8I6SDQ1_CIMLE|nr:uncharacterized protein LOC106674348 [Cimex lectularius]